MAYVAISYGLKSDIRNRINSMKEAEQKTVRVPDSNTVKMMPHEPAALSLIWHDHLHLKDQIPDSWTNKVRRLQLKYLCKAEHSESYAYLNVECVDDLFRVPNDGSSSWHAYEVTFDDEVRPPSPIMDEQITYHRQIADINSRWSKVQADVSKFLESCKSLNEAVKLWPDIKLYVPEQYIKRLNESVAREKKAQEANAALEALQSIDTDFAVAAVVGARMAQAIAGLSTP